MNLSVLPHMTKKWHLAFGLWMFASTIRTLNLFPDVPCFIITIIPEGTSIKRKALSTSFLSHTYLRAFVYGIVIICKHNLFTFS